MKFLGASLSAFLLLTCPFLAKAQGEVPVDMFTGTPSIDLSLWTVKDHDLSTSIGLSYNSNGLKLEESARFIGLGWTIMAGGSIQRDVRGLPDDFNGIKNAFNQGNNYDDRRGWLHANSQDIL